MANEFRPHPHLDASGPNPPPLPLFKGAWLGLAFLTGLNLFNYLDRYVLAAVLTSVQNDLVPGVVLSNALGGWLTSAFMIGYFCTAPIFGYLGDRSPRKWLIAGGIFVWSLGTVMSGYCHTYWTMVACRILVGFGEASYATLAPSWLSDLFPTSRRNNALTVFYIAIPVGSALGFILGGAALTHGNWRDGFLWAGLPGFVLAVLLLFLREPKRGAADGLAVGGSANESDGKKPTLRDVISVFKVPDYRLVTLGYIAYTFALGAFPVYAPKFLNIIHGVPLDQAAGQFGKILVITGLASTLIGGFTATAWRKRNRAAYGLLLTISAALAVPVAFTAFLASTLPMAMTCLVAAMFLLFLPTGPLGTVTIESVPVALRASAMAVSIFAIHIFGDFWSPGIVGSLQDHATLSTNPVSGLRSALMLLPAMLAVCAVFWGCLAWRQRKEPVSIDPTAPALAAG